MPVLRLQHKDTGIKIAGIPVRRHLPGGGVRGHQTHLHQLVAVVLRAAVHGVPQSRVQALQPGDRGR